jgi:monoamine oxidase
LGNLLKLLPAERGLTQGGLLERYVGGLPPSLANPDVLVSEEWNALDRVTWPDWLASRGASPGAVELMTVGGDSRGLSALYVLRQYAMLGDATLYKIRGGMDRLPAAMADTLDPVIRYGAAVTRIDPGARDVRVDYRSNGRRQTVSASNVIVTVPAAVLRRIATDNPALGERFNLLAGIDAFPASRFLVQTRRRTWLEEGLSGAARTDRPAEVWDCAYDAEGEGGLIGATVGGELGRRLAVQPRDRALAAGVSVVQDAFPNLPAGAAATYRWAADTWAGGAFAVFRPGRMIRIMPAAGRAVGRVHFAGEHTAAWSGWIEGAVQSADRAVDELLS